MGDLLEGAASVADELEQSIRDNAAGPKRAQGDSGSVEQHALADQIAADRYLAGKEAVKKKGLSIRFVRLEPPGAGGA